MKTRYYPFVLFLFLSSITLFFMTCSKNEGPVEPGQNNTGGSSSQLTIGSSGGKVEDSYGASINVPSGAVSSNLTISVRTVHADSIPPELQSAIVGNIIECLPHGAEFLQPVTIVLPVTSGFTYQAGDTLNLYIYNADSSAWEMTTIPAIVTADGQHLQASVTHFTDYGTNSSGGYNGGGHGFDNVNHSIDLSVAIDGWIGQYMRSLGGIGTKKRMLDCCMTLANAWFEFRYSSPGYNATITKVEGDQASCDKMENLNFSEGTPSDGYHINIRVRLCWVVCNPDLNLSISPSHFMVPDDRGKTADVSASVSCGNGPGGTFSGHSVKFVVASGPGRVDPPFAKINSSGTASGTYTVETRGTSNIRAELETCQTTEPTTATASANVVVDTLIPDHIYANVTIHHGGSDMPWTFDDRVEMMLTISIEDENVTVTGGEGSHYATCTSNDSECSIINLSAPDFTPTGNVTKNGNSLYVEFNPNLASINFTYYCDFGDGDVINSPVPAYGYMVSTIIAQNVKGTINMELGSFVTGSGSESFGEDLPISYEFEIVYGTRTHP
ncbi:MAG: hypothetical protein JXA06_06220 [Bacteroidetes bacterium]|nr:hypothetical protein [Bacteroidota bacterium]